MKAAPKLSSTRWRLYALGAVCATLLSLWLWGRGFSWGHNTDNTVRDAGYHLRPTLKTLSRLPQAKDIVVVDLPDEVPRSLLAKLVTQLRLARVVALDLMLVDRESQLTEDERPLFEEEGELTRWKHEDQQLANAIKRAGNVVVGSWPDVAPGDATIKWTQSAPIFARSARAISHVKVAADQEDGYVRSIHLWETVPATQSKPQHQLPALSLQAAALATGKTPQELAPPSGNNDLWINYLGPQSVFSGQRVVFALALDPWDPEDFKDKIVFVGQTSFRSKDVSDTPYGAMAGIFIQANATATLLDEQGQPQKLPFWVVALLTLGATLLLVVPLMRWTFLFCAIVALAEIVALWLLAAMLWAKWNLIAPVSVPTLAVFLTYNGIALYEYARARRTLGRVVGRTMLSRLLEARSEPTLGGKEEVATAFFCDLRGFSAWAQTRTPQQLIAELNEYTASVVRTVEPFGGRPIDFFGDGVFVLFEGEEHARRGVEAALAVSEALEHELRPHLRAGVALHTGPMVIGLVGHAHHFKPGAVGETVNIASRVQALSDDCGFSVLMTRQTLDAWQHDAPWANTDEDLLAQPVFCGARPIKGYASALEVFGLKPLAPVVSHKTHVKM